MYYFFDPFGCVKNQVDAENMMDCLNKAGWACASAAEEADVVIVNSCGFIESAKQESIDAVLGWRKLYPNKKIILAGCLAQRYAKELPELLPEADALMGIEDLTQITKVAAQAIGKSGNIIFNSESSNPGSTGKRPLLSLPGSAYVKISEGCNNCCSYCAIPLIRGSLTSRTIQDILEECRVLLARGIKELCIIGQDIGSFGDMQHDAGENKKLPDLLRAISSLKGNFWVRLLYIHPGRFPLQILDIMENDPRFLPYFDIPFQHASAKILTAMNRLTESSVCGHGENPANKYLELLETIRARLPNAVIRSTFLLGFPGETEEDFAALLDFQEKARLDWAGCFSYSREEGTKAYSMKGRVPAKIAAARKKIIEERQVPITEKNMERFAGQDMEVLIEEQVDDFWLGRLYCQAPDIDGAAVITGGNKKNPQPGVFAKCKVIARRGFDLEVQLVYSR
jgi:ribosomal protein S12 methylthiotransferase